MMFVLGECTESEEEKFRRKKRSEGIRASETALGIVCRLPTGEMCEIKRETLADEDRTASALSENHLRLH
jgi:hypothetical protein